MKKEIFKTFTRIIFILFFMQFTFSVSAQYDSLKKNEIWAGSRSIGFKRQVKNNLYFGIGADFRSEGNLNYKKNPLLSTGNSYKYGWNDIRLSLEKRKSVSEKMFVFTGGGLVAAYNYNTHGKDSLLNSSNSYSAGLLLLGGAAYSFNKHLMIAASWGPSFSICKTIVKSPESYPIILDANDPNNPNYPYYIYQTTGYRNKKTSGYSFNLNVPMPEVALVFRF